MKTDTTPQTAKEKADGHRAAPPCSPFIAGTGMMGGTEPGQRVTDDNAHFLPPGSVVRLDDSDGRLIHLHDGLWLYCNGGCWCYDTLDHMTRRLPGVLCHIPANVKVHPRARLIQRLERNLRDYARRMARLVMSSLVAGKASVAGSPRDWIKGMDETPP